MSDERREVERKIVDRVGALFPRSREDFEHRLSELYSALRAYHAIERDEHVAMELRRFELLVYIDHDGVEQISWEWSGERVTGMAGVGYLEAAKLGMYHDQLHDGED